MIPPPPPVPFCPACRALDETEPSIDEALKDILDCWSRFYPERGKKPEISYKHVVPILQQGPTCGLVAISMVLTLVPRNWTLQELLDDAQSLGFSKSGEMFSVDNMETFAKHVLGDYFKVEMYSGGLAAEKATVMECLIKGQGLYLVPYDSDRNHLPACLRGHKAHWAVLCGAVIDNGVSYVLARQGKSRHIGIWDYDALDQSNSNLFEIAPSRLTDDYTFYDLKKSMAGKFIKLEERITLSNPFFS
ncbi:actin maturation protease [Halyomorpha halys]|uniref:actin maturation protease n=1 Tax=Halyomorpha halys TaxID=286706 RepID=UPI0006D50DB5|nr:UPF0692 protein CG33108 [Halyomorpha halys]